MVDIKADFHLHTNEDRKENVRYSAQELIVHAAREGFNVLSITNHDTFTFNRDLQNFAEDNGILLIPGIEKTIKGRHVLILNAFPAAEKIISFEDLQKAKNDGIFVIAPHPFFKRKICLREKLFEHLRLFDALEFCFFYSKWINLNKKVLQLSEERGLPVVGNSDCHILKYMGICHSRIYAESQTIDGIFSAIRNQNIKIVSQPIFLPKLTAIYIEMILKNCGVTFHSKSTSPVVRSEKEVEEVCV